MTQRFWKTLAAFGLAWTMGTIIILINGTVSLVESLPNLFLFSMLVAAIVAVVEWGADTTEEKGYGPVLGFLLVLILNVIGILIVFLLPWRPEKYRSGR